MSCVYSDFFTGKCQMWDPGIESPGTDEEVSVSVVMTKILLSCVKATKKDSF